jgi:hypothetical protein
MLNHKPRKSVLAGPLTSDEDTLLPFNVQIKDHRVSREHLVQLSKAVLQPTKPAYWGHVYGIRELRLNVSLDLASKTVRSARHWTLN